MVAQTHLLHYNKDSDMRYFTTLYAGAIRPTAGHDSCLIINFNINYVEHMTHIRCN